MMNRTEVISGLRRRLKDGVVLPLRASILGSYLALGLLAVLIAAAALHFTSATRQQLDEAADRIMPQLVAVADIRAESNQLAGELPRCVAAVESLRDLGDDGDEARTHLDSAIAQLARWRGAVETVSRMEIDAEYATPMHEMVQAVERDAEALLAAARDGGHEQAITAARDALRKSHGSLDQHLSNATREMQSQLNTYRTMAGARWSAQIIFTASAAAIALLVAVFLALVLDRSITRPLRAMQRIAANASKGKLSERIELPASGQMRELVDAFNAMFEHVEQTLTRARDDNASLRAELSRRTASEAQLRHETMYDDLTSLPNRAHLLSHLTRCVERRRRDASFNFALLFVDLDRFKMVNDSLGHQIGDELLLEAAARLRKTLRTLDTVARIDRETTARLGGDEFAILLEGIKSPSRIGLVAERVQDALSQPFMVRAHEVLTCASIGIAVSDDTAESPHDMLRNADTAMHRAKSIGGGQYAVYDSNMHAEVRDRLELENDLRRAVDEQQFEVRYQPIVDLKADRLIGFESLIRWKHPQRGQISPSRFVPVAEETGLIGLIGEWVLVQACRQVQIWQRELGDNSDVRISVNVSPRQVKGGKFVPIVERVLRETRLDPKFLRLEITESMLMDDEKAINDVLQDLKSLGVELHLDDFGTGYSALSCLHRFPIDVLKIDREFITNMETNSEYASVVKGIMTLAKTLNLRVTAEGIETTGQRDLVRDMGCDYGQGYLFAKPLTASDAWRLLRERDEHDQQQVA